MQKKSLKKLLAACMAVMIAVSTCSIGLPAHAAELQTELATSSDADMEETEETIDNAEDALINECGVEATVEQEDENEALAEESEIVSDSVEKIGVMVHQQTYGTQTEVASGAIAGQINTGKRLEGFTITRRTEGDAIPGSIVYRAHCQSIGWQAWKQEGEFAGTSGKAKRLEAVQIMLNGELAKSYDIYYRVYMSNCGWLGWTKNGAIAGTVGLAASLEGMQVAIIKKEDTTSIKTERYASITKETLNDIIYSGHIQTYGDSADVKNGAMLGTVGQGKRLEAIKINLSHGTNQMFGTIHYQVHCQTYGWMKSVSEGMRAGTTGEAKRMEAINISLSGDIAKYCNVYYRVHCQKHGWLGWAKNGEYAGTQGNAYRLEAIEIRIVPKGSPAPGSTDNAFTTKQIIPTTSGYQLLVPYLDSIIAQCTNSSMTQEQKLRACYEWVRDHYVYRSISAAYPSNFKWHEYYAYQLVTNGYGNCYRFNSLFGHLAIRIGYTDVVFYKGYSSGEPHGWVTIDGKLYDPRYAHKYGGDFFGSTGGRVYTPYESSR